MSTTTTTTTTARIAGSGGGDFRHLRARAEPPHPDDKDRAGDPDLIAGGREVLPQAPRPDVKPKGADDSLLRVAAERGWRIRNLADGFPVPPFRAAHARRLVMKPVRALRGRRDERDTVVVGRHGFLAQHGQGRIGVWLGSTTRRGFSSLLSRARAALGLSLEIVQLGEIEAFGTIPATARGIDAAAAAIRVFCRRRVLHGNDDSNQRTELPETGSSEDRVSAGS